MKFEAIFILSESNPCLASLNHPFRRLDWCRSGWWRCPLKSYWCFCVENYVEDRIGNSFVTVDSLTAAFSQLGDRIFWSGLGVCLLIACCSYSGSFFDSSQPTDPLCPWQSFCKPFHKQNGQKNEFVSQFLSDTNHAMMWGKQNGFSKQWTLQESKIPKGRHTNTVTYISSVLQYTVSCIQAFYFAILPIVVTQNIVGIACDVCKQNCASSELRGLQSTKTTIKVL